jgi:hypothetical protein
MTDKKADTECKKLRAENNSLRKIIKAKDTLLLCYRIGNFGKADRALTIIERETKKLQKK